MRAFPGSQPGRRPFGPAAESIIRPGPSIGGQAADRGDVHRMRRTGELGDSFGGFPFELAESRDHSLAPRKSLHPPDTEALPLADVDAECVLDVLFAPVHVFHHDRVFGVGDWENRIAPSN